jgi:exoribonuclease R
VDKRDLDGHVKVLAAAILSSPRHAAQIEAAAKANKVLDDKRSRLEAKIADLDHTANVLAARLGSEDMPLARYDAAAGPLEKRLATLRADLKELDGQRQSKPRATAREVKASREAWEKRWDAATTEEKRSLLRRALRGRALLVGPGVKPGLFNSDRVTVESLRRKK